MHPRRMVFVLFCFVFWQKGSDAASRQARWICSEMVLIPVLRLFLLLFCLCVGAF